MNTRLSITGSLFLTLAAGCGGSTEENLPPQGEKYRFVANQIKMPQSKTQYAFDLDGNGQSENRLGGLLSTLSAFAKVDAQKGIDGALSSGDLLLLVELQTRDLREATQVGATLQGAKAQAMPDFTGAGTFVVDSAQPTASFVGTISAGRFRSPSPAQSSQRVTVELRLPLFSGAPALPLRLTNAHLEFDAAAAALGSGQLHGAIGAADVQSAIVPALSVLIGGVSDPNILLLFDTGDGAGGACSNPDGSSGKAGDGAISPCEVAGNGLVKMLLEPDVALTAGGAKDAISVGLGFTAVKASF